MNKALKKYNKTPWTKTHYSKIGLTIGLPYLRNIKVGDTVTTLGNSFINDGGGCTYDVVECL